MMIENATVLRYQDGKALVQCYAKSGCGGCVAQNSCGSKSLSALAGERVAPQFELDVPEPLAVGEQIQIGLPEQTLLASVFWLYCLPLCVLILSAVIFTAFFDNELLVACGMFFTTGSTFFVIKRWLTRRHPAQFTPVFIGRS